MRTFEQYYQLRENHAPGHEDFGDEPGAEEDFTARRDYEGQSELNQNSKQDLSMEIDGSPVYVKGDQIIHDDRVIGEIKMDGPQQKPTVYVTKYYTDHRQQIQQAIDQLLGQGM